MMDDNEMISADTIERNGTKKLHWNKKELIRKKPWMLTAVDQKLLCGDEKLFCKSQLVDVGQKWGMYELKHVCIMSSNWF